MYILSSSLRVIWACLKKDLKSALLRAALYPGLDHSPAERAGVDEPAGDQRWTGSHGGGHAGYRAPGAAVLHGHEPGPFVCVTASHCASRPMR